MKYLIYILLITSVLLGIVEIIFWYLFIDRRKKWSKVLYSEEIHSGVTLPEDFKSPNIVFKTGVDGQMCFRFASGATGGRPPLMGCLLFDEQKNLKTLIVTFPWLGYLPLIGAPLVAVLAVNQFWPFENVLPVVGLVFIIGTVIFELSFYSTYSRDKKILSSILKTILSESK